MLSRVQIETAHIERHVGLFMAAATIKQSDAARDKVRLLTHVYKRRALLGTYVREACVMQSMLGYETEVFDHSLIEVGTLVVRYDARVAESSARSCFDKIRPMGIHVKYLGVTR